MVDPHPLSEPFASRVRQDQPTILTLEDAMAEAHGAAIGCLQRAGFYHIQLVVSAVVSSIDPDDDRTTWVCATRVPDKPDPLLVNGLRLSADEAEGKWK